MGIISDIEIPLPPLAEQKRIVALLDEAFAGIDKAKANAEVKQLNAKELKSSVLSRWLHPQDSKFKTNWRMCSLDKLISSKGGNNKLIKGTLSAEPDARLFQAYSASGPDVWTTSAEYNGPGIVISAVGARCGKTFLATGKWTAVANTHVLIPGEDVDAKWLWYLTNDEKFWVKGGSAQPFVKVKDTLKMQRVIPPLLEQKRIATLLDEVFADIACFDDRISTELTKLSELKASLLAQAFAGELTA